MTIISYLPTWCRLVMTLCVAFSKVVLKTPAKYGHDQIEFSDVPLTNPQSISKDLSVR